MRSLYVLAVLCVLSLSEQVLASEALLKRFFTEITTLQAAFDQQVVDEQGSTLEISSGRLYLSRPGKFRWDYDSRDEDSSLGQQIVADGKSIFMFDPDLEQVTQRSLEDALGQVPSLLLVQTGANIEKHFTISDFGLTDGLSWVALKPKSQDAGYKELLIGFAGDVLNTIVLTDGLGNETRLSLTKVANNPSLRKSTFEFIPPEGADVLRE